jgi:hypothetical protein
VPADAFGQMRKQVPVLGDMNAIEYCKNDTRIEYEAKNSTRVTNLDGRETDRWVRQKNNIGTWASHPRLIFDIEYRQHFPSGVSCVTI